MRFVDLTGRVFDRLTVTEFAGKRRWKCKCICGRFITVLSYSLTSGHTKSCGCYRVERGQEHGATINLRHGEASNGEESPEYRAWASMLSRCNNPNHRNFKNYGARGIHVCDRWHVFEHFLEDVGRRPTPAHSLDRYPNPDGNYEPGNVRWATSTQQNRNTRFNRVIVVNGESLPLAAWLERTGIPRKTFYNRLAAGMNERDALFTPSKRARRNPGSA